MLIGRRAVQRKRNYGLTDRVFKWLWEEQDGACAICSKPLVDSGQNGLHVDHDHNSGQVRGLLCSNCNWGLGQFKDKPALLRSAARYLEENSALAQFFLDNEDDEILPFKMEAKEDG